MDGLESAGLRGGNRDSVERQSKEKRSERTKGKAEEILF
jgi:hypothetical protein